MTGLDDLPRFAGLRDREPVSAARLASGGRVFLVARYADVRRVLSDPVFSRAAALRDESVVLTPSSKVPGHLLAMDQPNHTRLRRLVAGAFTTAAVQRMRPRIQQITDELITAMTGHGPPADFIASFAAALPALVISEMMGVPGQDRHQLMTWMDVSLSMGSHTPGQVQEASGQFQIYLRDLIAAKRRAPAGDLISALIAARDDDDKLSETELLSTVFILIAGGYETTASLLTNSLLVLHRHPVQLSLLCAKPELIPGAVEELLRYVPIAWSTTERITLAEVELGGQRIPAGATVVPLTYSANYDPDLTSDAGRLDVTRPALTPHMAFGHGIHRCIGAPLARAEMTIALTTLLSRLPALRPAVPETELTWKKGSLTIGPTALPVTWHTPTSTGQNRESADLVG
jgi:nocardicin N-oxygenase